MMIEELTAIMPDNDLHERFGYRIKERRKQKNGHKENAAFQIVLKHRAHMLRIASVSVQNIRQFLAVIAS